MAEEESEIVETELLDCLRQLSDSKASASYREFQLLIDRAGREISLTGWNEVVTLVSDHCAHWQTQWLFSPSLSPDTRAAEESDGWRRVYAACSGILIDRSPHLRETIDRLHRLRCLDHAIQRRMQLSGGRIAERSYTALLSHAAILVGRVGLTRLAEHLYAMALYPKGTVGRAGSR